MNSGELCPFKTSFHRLQGSTDNSRLLRPVNTGEKVRNMSDLEETTTASFFLNESEEKELVASGQTTLKDRGSVSVKAGEKVALDGAKINYVAAVEKVIKHKIRGKADVVVRLIKEKQKPKYREE